MANTYPAVKPKETVHQFINLSDEADFGLRVIQLVELKPEDHKNKNRLPTTIAQFKVIRRVLEEIPATPTPSTADTTGTNGTTEPPAQKKGPSPFDLMKRAGEVQSNGNALLLKDDFSRGFQVLLQILHNCSTVEADSTQKPKERIRIIWELIATLNKYNIDPSICRVWFSGYVGTTVSILGPIKESGNDIDSRGIGERTGVESSIAFIAYKNLVYPCWKFNEAVTFSKISRDLVYESIHPIEEANLIDSMRLDMPKKVYARMNHARGGLKRALCHKLWNIRRGVLGRSCKCRFQAYVEHEDCLVDLKIWPFELQFPMVSMRNVLESLDLYRPQLDSSLCAYCRTYPFKTKVASARREISVYLEGLCLDCMALSIEDRDEYVDRRDNREWSKDCRVKHHEPTSFYSNMGKPLIRS